MRSATCALFMLLVLGGCASTPSESPTPPPQAPGKDTGPIAIALYALQDASPATLTRAAAILSAPEIAATPRGADLGGVGKELAVLLYPELPDPGFSTFAESLTYGGLFQSVKGKTVQPPAAGESDFFRLVIPALVFLDPSAVFPASSLDAFEAGLREADRITGKSSILPPYLLALIAERRALKNRALDLLAECVYRDPSFYIGQRIIARTAMDSGKPTEAANAAARTLLYVPDDIDMLLLRARALEQTGDWYQALNFIDLILAVRPDSAEVLLLKARVVADDEKNTEEALALLTDAEVKSPDNPGFPELRGDILMSEGNTNAGLAALNRALELEPDRPGTLRILLDYSIRGKSWAQAASYLSRIPITKRIEEDFAAGFQVHWALGSYPEAIDMARALVAAGYGEYPRVLLVRALHANGADPEALSIIENGLAQPKSAGEKSRLLVMRAIIGQGADPEKALTDLRMALLEDPDDTDALLAIAALLETRRDYRQAADYLKHVRQLMPERTDLTAKILDLQSHAEAEKTAAGGSPTL